MFSRELLCATFRLAICVRSHSRQGQGWPLLYPTYHTLHFETELSSKLECTPNQVHERRWCCERHWYCSHCLTVIVTLIILWRIRFPPPSAHKQCLWLDQPKASLTLAHPSSWMYSGVTLCQCRVCARVQLRKERSCHHHCWWRHRFASRFQTQERFIWINRSDPRLALPCGDNHRRCRFAGRSSYDLGSLCKRS